MSLRITMAGLAKAPILTTAATRRREAISKAAAPSEMMRVIMVGNRISPTAIS
ncbi:hypothetical protein [Acidithiobacillus sulfuriphilus]|uniref:Uncharacterized protein n=1 Tax=Acidithiobacillus sulfuriphilus TaxID=1867749 RepID=A0ACD5HQI8_9PROT|nr:hypothetical protein [Acidithiobacillus sulfuriphilus]